MENKKKTYVISAFPGCGKSWCFNNLQDKYKMLDSDSSNFSWAYGEEGQNLGRNPDFPQNYISHIKENLNSGEYDFIFVSSHEDVRNALEKENIPYFLVYPENTRHNKEIWKKRLVDRGSPNLLVETVMYNWENWIDDISMETWPILIPLGDNDNGVYIDEKLLDDTKACEWDGYFEVVS